MSAYFASLSGLEKVYLLCAVFGGSVFLLRSVLMLIGADHGEPSLDMDFDNPDSTHLPADIELHDGHADTHHPVDFDPGLKMLTFQGVTAFAMMFGLGGLTTTRGFTWAPTFSFLFAGLCGLFAMWFIARAFAAMGKLQSSGNLNIYDAIGEDGQVYLTIPAEGSGKIQVPVSGRLKVIEAMSQDGSVFETGDPVHVIDIEDDKIAVVRRS